MQSDILSNIPFHTPPRAPPPSPRPALAYAGSFSSSLSVLQNTSIRSRRTADSTGRQLGRACALTSQTESAALSRVKPARLG